MRRYSAQSLGNNRRRTRAAGMISSYDHQHPYLIYSDDAPATRVFLRDVLGWPCVEDTLGGGPGWLIFNSGPSEMGVHPTRSVHEGQTYESPRHHLITLMCDDISQTVADLQSKGAQFRGEIRDQGYGLVISMEVPGSDDIMLYQAKHPLAYTL